MSTAEILSLVSLISYIAAGISFVLAVFFWIKFNIPAVIGDLSGRTARKSIARIRESNERAGGQGYKPSSVNASRGKLTGTMPDLNKAAEKAQRVKMVDNQRPETGLLEDNKAEVVDFQYTELLEDNDATGLLVDEDATAPLYEEPRQPVKRSGGKKLVMLDEVILIHTQEVIG